MDARTCLDPELFRDRGRNPDLEQGSLFMDARTLFGIGGRNPDLEQGSLFMDARTCSG